MDVGRRALLGTPVVLTLLLKIEMPVRNVLSIRIEFGIAVLYPEHQGMNETDGEGGCAYCSANVASAWSMCVAYSSTRRTTPALQRDMT